MKNYFQSSQKLSIKLKEISKSNLNIAEKTAEELKAIYPIRFQNFMFPFKRKRKEWKTLKIN